MSQRKVVIEVDVDGSTSIDAQGFKGNSCSLATKELEMALVGAPVDAGDRKYKPDFYATNPGATVRQRN